MRGIKCAAENKKEQGVTPDMGVPSAKIQESQVHTNASSLIVGAHWYRLRHLYDEAAARVVARHTYDANDCLTLTGTPSHT